jgi:OmpA-OmpF porin, OOP family
MNKVFLLFFLMFFVKAWSQTPENLGASINTTYNEFSPVIAPDGKMLYFLREGHPQNRSKEKYSCDVWSSTYNGGRWNNAIHLQSPFNSNISNSIYSISPDGNTIICNWQDDSPSLSQTKGFGIIKKTETGWARAVKLEIPKFEKMCKGRFQYGSLAADGKTFLMSFSTNKKSIEDDIYISFLGKDGSWSQPISLGDDINTNATESIPFLAPDGYTLYFSSDRPGGQGSNDIYVSQRLDRSFQKWSKPRNLGAHVNTSEYDGYFSLSAVDEYAYFVTRKGSFGKSDIVRMKLSDIQGKKEEPVTTKPEIADNTNPTKTNPSKPTPVSEGGGAIGGAADASISKEVSQADPVVLLSGKITDAKTQKTPAGAQVIYEDLATGQELGVATPDPLTGIYKIVLPYGKKYGVTAIGTGYVGSGINIDLSQVKNGKYLELTGKDLSMIPAESGQKITLNNIFFEFGKANLEPESYSELNRLIEFLNSNKSIQVEVSGHTDSIGSDETNNRLSLGRADAVKTYLLDKGKLPPNRIVTRGYGKTRPIASNDTEAGQQANRRVEFLILKN